MLDLEKIIVQFETRGSINNYIPYGSGHIHDTYLVETAETESSNYLLQKINNKVFIHVPEMMKNIDIITRHMKDKLRQIPDSQPSREVLTLVPTAKGNTYYIDDKDQYWRMYQYIAETKSLEKAENAIQAEEGGKALGKFQRLLADFPSNSLHITIPDFHHIRKRLRAFKYAVDKDTHHRAEQVTEEIQFVRKRRDEMSLIYKLGKAGFLPERVTHNDTKFNNLLFDDTDKVVAWVDLDTVMPGFIHYDFGDAIRTLANTTLEDDEDLNKVHFHFNYFQSFTKGYLSEAESVLTPIEVIHLAFSAKLMTYLMGLRFLTDYLAGDVYYKIQRPDHNLIRARNQFKLLEEMENAFEDMKQLVESQLLF